MLFINNPSNWEGGGVKNWSKLLMNSTKKLPIWERGVSNPEKLPTSFMDGPLAKIRCDLSPHIFVAYFMEHSWSVLASTLSTKLKARLDLLQSKG